MKYAALTLCTVATAIFALTLVGVANQIGSRGRPLAPVQNALAPLSAQQIADQGKVELALQSLDQVPSVRFFASPVASDSVNNSQGSVRSTSTFDGNIFALSPKNTEVSILQNKSTSSARAALRPLPLPLVTVVLESGVNGKAVIDGKLSRVGDTVVDGMVVSSIDIASVTFSSGKEVLEVRMPLERLRVLGAFPRSVKGN